MDVFRFIGWWWAQRDGPERVLFIFLFWILATIPWMFFYGVTAVLLIFFGGLAFSGFCFILFRACQSIRSEWQRYQAEREAEAQNIVNRLSGKPKTTAEEILEKLRASHDRFKSI